MQDAHTPDLLEGSHHQDGQLATGGWLPTEVYTAVLDAIVIACVDIVVLGPGGRVLLGHRSRHPFPEWWLFGGRMPRGLSFEQAAASNLKRELGVELAPERFRYDVTVSTAWSTRDQDPPENGVHTVNAIVWVSLGDEELAVIRPNDEYVEVGWFTPHEILKGTYHAVIQGIATRLVGAPLT